MTQLKQRTVVGDTISLHKLKNPMKDIRNTPYLYEVRINGSTDEEVFTRTEADSAFEYVIETHKRGAEMRANDRGSDDWGFW